MENIKFISGFTSLVPRESKKVGDCVYFDLKNGNVVKTYCVEDGVWIEVVNPTEGKIDSVKLPFRNYFQLVRCSQGAPEWCQHISHGKWEFEGTYRHVLPKQSDYQKLADAMEKYIAMFE